MAQSIALLMTPAHYLRLPYSTLTANDRILLGRMGLSWDSTHFYLQGTVFLDPDQLQGTLDWQMGHKLPIAHVTHFALQSDRSREAKVKGFFHRMRGLLRDNYANGMLEVGMTQNPNADYYPYRLSVFFDDGHHIEHVVKDFDLLLTTPALRRLNEALAARTLV